MAMDETVLKDAIRYGIGGSSVSPAPQSLYATIVNAYHKPPLDADLADGTLSQEDYIYSLQVLRDFYDRIAEVVAHNVIHHVRTYGELNNSSYLQVANTGGSDTDPLENIT